MTLDEQQAMYRQLRRRAGGDSRIVERAIRSAAADAHDGVPTFENVLAKIDEVKASTKQPVAA